LCLGKRLLESKTKLPSSKEIKMAKQNATTQPKPNILIIWGDDIGWFNISANNNGMDAVGLQ
jgi:hypothetical protein